MQFRTLSVLAHVLALASMSSAAPAADACPTQKSPSFVLVSGAFHRGEALDNFAVELRALGNKVETFGLVTVDNATATITDDANALVAKRLDPLINQQGKDVILFLHSYAGLPGSVAIAGLSKQERQKNGKAGGIVGLIYQSAFIPLLNQTLLQAIGGSYAAWQKPESNGLISVIDPDSTFYNDVSPAKAKIASISFVRKQSTLSFNTPSFQPHYGDSAYDNNRYYLHTDLDQALPPFAQDLFVTDSQVNWNVLHLNTSHSPWWSQPKSLAQQVNRIRDEIVG